MKFVVVMWASHKKFEISAVILLSSLVFLFGGFPLMFIAHGTPHKLIKLSGFSIIPIEVV